MWANSGNVTARTPYPPAHRFAIYADGARELPLSDALAREAARPAA